MKLTYLISLAPWATSVLAAPADTSQQCGVWGDGDKFYDDMTVKNVVECMTKCQADSRCKSSEFKPSNNRCWLYDTPTAQAKIRDDSKKSTWVFNDKGCPTLQCGVYGDGTKFYTKKTVQNVEECTAMCKADEKCRSSQFRPSNGNCWLYATPTTLAMTKKDTKGTWIFNDRDCPRQCGVDGDGTDFFAKNTVGSVRECQKSCNDDSGCLSSQFRPSNGNCWLYGKPAAEAKTINGTENTWIFNDRDCPLPPELMCQVYGDGTNFYSQTQVDSQATCQSLCKDDDKCKSSQFRPSNGNCWLYAESVATAKTSDSPEMTWVFNDKECPLPE